MHTSSHHYSRRRRHRHSKTKHKRPGTVIRIDLKTSSISVLTKKKKIYPNQQSFLLTNTKSNESTTLSSSVLNSEFISHKNSAADDYHRKTEKRKYKYSRRRCFCCFCCLLTLIIICALTILLIFLLKPNSIARNQNKTVVLRWNKAGLLISGTVGIPGAASNQLEHPYDVSVDYMNNIFVADTINHRIQKFRFGNTIGQTIAGNGTCGTIPYQLCRPSQMLLNSNQDLFIAQYGYHDVLLWPNGGNKSSRIAGTGTSGANMTQLRNPCGLAVDPITDTLYIGDLNNDRIVSYAKNANSSTLIFGGQGRGVNRTQLSGPAGIYFDFISNSLYIANYYGQSIVRYVLGANQSTLFTGNSNGSFGSGESELKTPLKVILDPMGNIYVADGDNHRVQFYPPDQMNGTTILGTTNVSGTDPSLLNRPRSIAFDNQLNLYVVEEDNHRVQKFLRY